MEFNREKIEIKVASFCEFDWEDCVTIDDMIKHLKFLKKNGTTHVEIYAQGECMQCGGDCYEMEIGYESVTMRLETDEEHQKRLKNHDEWEKNEEEYQRKKYNELKKKFEK